MRFRFRIAGASKKTKGITLPPKSRRVAGTDYPNTLYTWVAARLRRAARWLVPAECVRLPRLWKAGVLPALNLLILGCVLYHELKGTPGYELAQIRHYSLSRSIWASPLNIMMFYRFMLSLGPTIPLVALLLRLLDKEGERRFKLSFSLPALVVSEAAVLWACIDVAEYLHPLEMLIAGGGCLASFFVCVPFGESVRRLKHHRRAAAVALMGCLAPLLGIWLASSFWAFTSGGTVLLVRGILWIFGSHPHALFMKEFAPSIDTGISYAILSSKHVSIKIYTACSGVKGIAMMLYMLAVFLLLDWSFFSRRLPVVTVCLLGAFAMICVNALRIACIFGYARWLAIHSSPIEGQLISIDLFHTNIGWLVDSAAIALFLLLVYRQAANTKPSAS